MAVEINKKVSVEQDAEVIKVPKKVSELDTIMAAVRKQKGDQILIQGNKIPVVERIPTGMFEVDLALGGGFPRGRYSLVYGPEGSGKTGITFCAIAQAQRMPPPCNKAVFIDLEGTFDAAWAAMYGVDTEALIVVKPSYGEEACDMMDALVRAEDVAILVLDSLAVVVSTKEMEQSAEKFDVGTTAILIKRMCNKLVMALAMEEKRGHRPAVIMINQTRFKVGVMFGDPETIPGGQTMKFLSSLTLRLYGKNKILKEAHPELAAFKETNLVIKKAKVPITRLSVEYDMCVFPHNGLSVGETRSWNAVSSNLKELGNLTKETKGWQLKYNGKVLNAPTLVTIQDTYEADSDFATELQQVVVKSEKGKMFLHAASGAAV